MKKIIAVTALAAGFLAWRMGAMQQEAQELIKFKDKNGVEFTLPRNQAMLSLTISNLIDDLGDSSDTIPLGFATEAEVKGLLTGANYEFILNAHNQNALAIKDISDQVRKEKAKAKARGLAERDYAYSNARLQQALSYLNAADYLNIPELIEKYSRIAAGMLCSDAAMRLLQENNPEHIELINRINQRGTYAGSVMSYLYEGEWFLLHTLAGHAEEIITALFSPDGSKIVTACWDRTAKIWNTKTGALERTLAGHDDEVNSADFSPDGSKVVTASDDHTAKIWNAQTGALEHTLTGHEEEVKSVKFSSDGSKIVTASDDRKAKIWNAQTGVLEHTLAGHTESLNTAEFSPNGSKIVTASWDHTANIWNVQTGVLEHTLAGHTESINTAEFSPDGSKIVTASGDHTAKIWNAQTGVLERTLTGHTQMVNSARFSPNGSKIVTASDDRGVNIWNAQTGVLERSLAGGAQEVYSAEFSPDGSKIVAAYFLGMVIVWNAHTGVLEQRLENHTEFANAAVFSPNGHKIVTASSDQTAAIWAFLPAYDMEQALFLNYLVFIQEKGGLPGWASGWGRTVMNNYNQRDQGLIKDAYPMSAESLASN